MNFFGNKGRSSDIVSQTETKNVYTCTFYGVVFVIHFDYIYLDLPFIKKNIRELSFKTQDNEGVGTLSGGPF